MADTKPADGAAGEKLQFSGVSIIEIGQGHGAAASSSASAAAADSKTAEPAPAAAPADDKPKAAADKPKTEDDKPNHKDAEKPAADKAANTTPAADASAAKPSEPAASLAPTHSKGSSLTAPLKANGSLKEPLTPTTPIPAGGATPTTAPASPATEGRALGDAKEKDAKKEEKKDEKKGEDKPKDKKKEKKDAKPIRDVNPALAARVKAANQFNRKYKAAKEMGLEGDELLAAANAGARRNTKLTAEEASHGSKDASGSPVVVVESDADRMRRERREKRDRLNLAEKVQHYKLDIDPELEARIATVENHDDTGAWPEVATLLKDNERSGHLEERSNALIGYSWTPHLCVIHGGHFYWIRDEKTDKQAAGRVKFTKAKVRLEINDSVLELYDPDVPKKPQQTRHFRVPEHVADFIDTWLLAIKKAKLKFYQTRAIALQKEEEKQRKESGQTVPSAAVLSPQAAKAAALAAKRKAAQQMLTKGIQLLKHQAGTRYPRAVWCTPQMDRLCWGDPKMDTVKGFVLLDDITEVVTHIALAMKPGSHGIAIVHNLHSFSGTDEPVLQFECDDPHVRDAWVAALRAFTDKPI